MLLAACSFDAAVSNLGSDGPDAAIPGDDPLPGNEGPASIAPCKTPDAMGLVLCLEFEDDLADNLLDDSSPARRSVTSTGLTQATTTAMPVGGTTRVVDVGTSSRTYVAQAPALDLGSAYTFALWIKPDAPPAPSTARGLLDHEGQYAVIVSANAAGNLYNRCQHTGVARYEYTTRLPADVWQLIACTFDGVQLCAWRWASPTDHEHYCHTVSVQPATAGTHGLAIGHLSSEGAPHDPFDGALDSVQIFDRAMTEAQLCAIAGQPANCMPCDSGCL